MLPLVNPRRSLALFRYPCRPRYRQQSSSGRQNARNAKLREVYKPFSKLKKGSTEYMQLAKSGKVWENYFRPFDDTPYRAVQEKHKDILSEIDEWKELMKPQIPDLAKLLVAEYAHQSVKIENNPLELGESIQIFNLLKEKIFGPIRLASLQVTDLLQIALPQYGSEPDTSSTNELKNHILISQWIAEYAAAHPGTSGLNEEEVKQVSAKLVQGTSSEQIYAYSWGGRVELGGYRKAPIIVSSNPLEIFPYPQEIPACIERFFKWRDSQHVKREIHPLILACHSAAYFVHIHPFPDGNGRACRVLMHDYMVRQGYLPVVFMPLEREEYLRTIKLSHEGNPEEFVLAVLSTQLDELRSFYFRQS